MKPCQFLIVLMSFGTVSSVANACLREAEVYAMAEYSRETGAVEDMIHIQRSARISRGLYEVEVFFQDPRSPAHYEWAIFELGLTKRCELKYAKIVGMD